LASTPANLLIVDDDTSFSATLKRALRPQFRVVVANCREKALGLIHDETDIVLLDLRLREDVLDDESGLALLTEVRETHPAIPVVMMTAYGDVQIAVMAMQRGASDFLQKPFDVPKLRTTLSNVLEATRLRKQVAVLQEAYRRLEPGELVGQSAQMASVKKSIQAVSDDAQVNVLIQGETGTGKELVARAVHKAGRRSDGPFMPVAVAAVNQNLIESELFGHEAGAFTGARKQHVGVVERASGGVLFLDEIGDLPAEAQVKMLRFLEDRTFTRVGGDRHYSVDVQVVAASNRNLREAVAEGLIREDLYYRLNSVTIHLPALRERADDIPLLLVHFLGLLHGQGRTRIQELSNEAMAKLLTYSWPGNVRELKTAIERAIIFARMHGHTTIEADDLPPEVRDVSSADTQSRTVTVPEEGVDLDEEVAAVELAYIDKALSNTSERKTDAWKLLGLNDRFALRRRVKAVFRRHPALAEQFPRLNRLF